MTKLIPDTIPPQPSAAFSAAVRDARDNSIGYLLAQAQRQVHRELGVRLQRHGITVAQWSVLVMLWEVDGLTHKELADRLTIETATISRTVDRMVRDGLVERVRSDADRRQVHVHLTDKGAGLWRELVPEAETMLTFALADFTAEEEQTLRRLLQRVIANIQSSSPSSDTNPEESS